MKKISLIALFASLIAFGASAKDGENKPDIATIKSQIIASLNKEKSIVDTEIACTNAASKREDLEKCRDAKKSSMDALRAEREAAHKDRLEKRKENIEGKIEKLDAKNAGTSAKK